MMLEHGSLNFPYDIKKIRADFPILQQEHSPNIPLVYLDNAASSQHPIQVIEAIDDYYRRYHANVHRGIHKLSEQATEAYEEARKKIKRLINAGSWREVIFTRGTTESINLVAQTWGRANLQPGDAILSTQMEHHSNIVPWQMLAAEKGCRLLYIPVLANGTLDMEAFAKLLNNNPVKLVAVVHSSNVLGTINPIEEFIRQAHDSGAIVVIDGAQSVPHMTVDVQALDVDFLAFSGHKMVGPTGIGILYGKRELLNSMPPWMGGGDMIEHVTLNGSTWNDIPYKFEAGTPSIAAAIGLGYAADYLTDLSLEFVQLHERLLTQYVLERLSEVPGIKIYGPDTENRGAVVSFTLENIHPHDVAQVLDSRGVAVRAGHHCAQPLHTSLSLTATTRASFYIYNTPAEVEALVDAVYAAKRIFA
jgi:cysteine desulfurase/selenocysteine lyase